MKDIILASASPRRKDLLAVLGVDFDVMVSDADESFAPNLTATENTENIALKKARGILPFCGDTCIVIGADTVVSINGRILGKPSNEGEAAEMLSMLSGASHEVYTGFALLRKKDGRVITGCEGTTVFFRQISDDEIKSYIRTGEPMDKAGAYGLQGKGSVFISGIHGDYNNVVGLPLFRIASALKELGTDVMDRR